ncbi:unannotated protein [freshwater metagenome]|uniref:Unannotated protein n=1 Tax=freshwater metagenome TaxID=449393 RepID=A0A6J7CWT1_9ZZZZ
MFKDGLDTEDEVRLWAAKVEEPPVEALVDARVLGDRGLGLRLGDDLERRNLDLEPTELDPLVVCELTRDTNKGSGVERSDEFRQCEAFRRIGCLRVEFTNRLRDELNGTGLVTQDDELNRLLVTDGVDPPCDNNVAIRESGKGCHS